MARRGLRALAVRRLCATQGTLKFWLMKRIWLFLPTWIDDNDLEVALAAVASNGSALQFAATPLRADKELVHAAITNNGVALEYAAEPLRANKEMVLAAVGKSGFALCFDADLFRGVPKAHTLVWDPYGYQDLGIPMDTRT